MSNAERRMNAVIAGGVKPGDGAETFAAVMADGDPAAIAPRSALARPGNSCGSWTNPIIKAAMPALLLMERNRGHQQDDGGATRAQFIREAHLFQQVLQVRYPADDIHRLVYLLYSCIDETLGDTKSKDALGITLGVEFYQNAWGGEKCFEHLQQYCREPEKHGDILAFYDLILSLGFTGKYRIMERGIVLLADLRHQLDKLLYGQDPLQSLAQVEDISPPRKVRRLRPRHLFCGGVLLLLTAWGIAAWSLHDASRALRSAILAWTPAAPRRINLMATLPQPLPRILSEGWLEVREDPRGWLLIFTSDGAFATGKSVLSADFQRRRNIERLGEALAPWPGDLEVIGHTDSQPFRNNTRDSNQRLSAARAATVASVLRAVMQPADGVPRAIVSLGKGESEPIGDNATPQGRSKNRRVDILWKIGHRDNGHSGADGEDNSDVRQLLRDIREKRRQTP
ncbi:OmpA family protein [Erwinia sp. E602]|uniref:DotU/TssL family secretion system protein n=1 Tax=Erwinia sp. E602 TaxID=2675378 RepID=UPI001BA6CE04|nr:DotU/TssL family secretion system protein [Erwinia sp. E602]QUG75885.1 OmpA family protein [Erwinia sp. E602]